MMNRRRAGGESNAKMLVGKWKGIFKIVLI